MKQLIVAPRLAWQLGCLCACLMLNHQSSAQDLHAIVIGDISPAAQWGKYTANVVLDVMSVQGLLADQMPRSRLHIKRFQFEEDADSNSETILLAVQQLAVKPQDTILLFYSGHGASDDQGHYLALASGKLYRKQLLDALTAKGARLTVLLTDCCNLRSDGHRVFAPAFRSQPPKAPSPLFQSLLLQQAGIVDINGSAPGEGAFFTPYNEDDPEMPGSLFTKALCAWAYDNSQRSRTWDELVRAVSLKVHQSFHDHYPKGVGEGNTLQKEQNVYPISYPGKPQNKGPRTGFVIRDFPGKGAVIISVEAGSPASQAYWLGKDTFISLAPQQVITKVNDQPVANTEQAVKAIAGSPQIVRFGIRDATKGSFDVLLRLRY